MKRYLITLTILLLSLGLKAQSGYTYHYWFDQDTEHRQTGLLGDGHLLLDADDLETGVHMLHVTLEGSGLTSPQTYLFYKFDPTQSSPNLVYHYWFDQNTGDKHTGLLGNGHLLLDVNTLEAGVHSLHVTLEDSGLTAPQTYLFYKFDPTQSSPDLVYHYWFDQNTGNKHTGILGDGHLLLDVNTLEAGVHSLHLTLEDAGLTAPQTYLFYKFDLTQASPDLVYHYWFDQDTEHRQSGLLGDGHLLLDADDLEAGVHTLHVTLEGSGLNAPQSYLFYKFDTTQGSPDLVYHYWFDQDTEHRQTGLLGEGQLLLNADTLEIGVHMLHLTLEGGELTSPQTYLFYKFDPTQASPDLVYHYWFDQDTEHRQAGLLGEGQLLLNADTLEIGVHMLHLTLEDDELTSPQTYLFYKFPMEQNSPDLVYHYWFDQDTEHRQTGLLGEGHLLLDADTLELGVHMLHVTMESNGLTSPQTYLFYKPAPTEEENPNYVLHYWFDDDNTVVYSHPVGSAFELEVGDLSDGLHALRVQLDNGKSSVPQCYWFYKRPVGGYVSGWEYWVNDDNDYHVTKISPNVDTLSIISLLPVEPYPIRSSCFYFHPNGDAPYINAKNKITFRVWLWDSFAERSAMYVDENVSEPIVADTLERNTITTIPTPGDNQIQWFWLDAHAGQGKRTKIMGN